MKDEQGYADRMNSLPKFVASTALDEMEWNASPIKGNIAEAVNKLKQQPGQGHFSLRQLRSCQYAEIEHDLVDQYNLLVYPVVLGSGKRLFRDGSKTNLSLVETKNFSSGAVALVYHREKKE